MRSDALGCIRKISENLFENKFLHSYEILLNISECTGETPTNISKKLLEEIYVKICKDIPDWNPTNNPINIIDFMFKFEDIL